MDKKIQKVKELNDYFARSNVAKAKQVKAKLIDGKIIYTQLFPSATGQYEGKISFREAIMTLDGKELRELVAKYLSNKRNRTLAKKVNSKEE